MSEKSHIIVLTSVLKPVDDIRMFYKLGKTIQKKMPASTIHLVGKQGSTGDYGEKFQIHPIFNFKRLHWKRFFAGFMFLKLLFSVKPTIIISCTFELLPACIIYKWLKKCILIYDIQENYVYNIRYTKIYSGIIKPFLAGFIRAIELTASFWVNHYWLAEKCYAEELPFVKQKYLILENKFVPPQEYKFPPARRGYYHLLLMGTIAESYGVFQAIQLVKQLHKIDKNFTLTICGYCSNENDLKKIQALSENTNYIKLIGLETPVSYNTITEQIYLADIALLPYHINKSFAKRIPTKFYECLAYNLPMLIQPNPHWENFFTQNNYNIESVIFFNFYNSQSFPQLQNLIESFQNIPHIQSSTQDIFWDSEAAKLSAFLNF